MAHSYSVDAVLQFLDVGLPEEEDSDDDFDGYIDEEREEDDIGCSDDDENLGEMECDSSDSDTHGNAK